MLSTKPFYKPSSRPTLDTRTAIVVSAVVVAPFVLVRFGLFGEYNISVVYGICILAALVAIAQSILAKPEPPTPSGRRLETDGDFLSQIDESNAVVERIDATRVFEYRILRRPVSLGLRVRLYQDGRELTFYPSDDGAAEAIRRVVQISWPPKPRVSAGYTP